MVPGGGGGDRGWMLFLHAVVRRVREFVGQVNASFAAGATVTNTVSAPTAASPVAAATAAADVERLSGAQRHGVAAQVEFENKT
jgi:hypothetical protein